MEIPKRKDDEMPSLGVFATNFIYYLVMFVIYFKLLEFLSYTTTVKNCRLSNPPYVFLLHKDFDFRSIVGTEAHI